MNGAAAPSTENRHATRIIMKLGRLVTTLELHRLTSASAPEKYANTCRKQAEGVAH